MEIAKTQNVWRLISDPFHLTPQLGNSAAVTHADVICYLSIYGHVTCHLSNRNRTRMISTILQKSAFFVVTCIFGCVEAPAGVALLDQPLAGDDRFVVPTYLDIEAELLHQGPHRHFVQ